MTGGTYPHSTQVHIPTNLQIFGGWANNFSSRNPALNVTSLQSATTGILRADRTSSGPFTLDGLTLTANMGAASGGAVGAPISMSGDHHNCRFSNCIARQNRPCT